MKAGPWETVWTGMCAGKAVGIYARRPAGSEQAIVASVAAWSHDVWTSSAYPPGCTGDGTGPCRRDEGTFTEPEAAKAWADAQLVDMGWELEGEQ